jgi:DUF4097 and DUF4098 domain-containing protein YvlB
MELFAQTFDVSSSARIEAELADADLRVESRRGDGVEVRVTGHGDGAEDIRAYFQAMDFEASASGSSVRIRADDSDMGPNFWSRGSWAGITVWISAPEGSDLHLRTSDGDIEISDFSGDADLRSSDGDVVVGDIAGDVQIHTSDGDIIAGRLSGSEVRVRTSDGDVEIDRIEAGAATLQSGDGDVDVAFSGGSLEAQSGDGDLHVEILDDADVRLRTGDGDIQIWVPAGYGADVVLEGEDLEIDQDVRLRGRISDDRISGTLNDGGAVLEATTGDGTVALRTQGRAVR